MPAIGNLQPCGLARGVLSALLIGSISAPTLLAAVPAGAPASLEGSVVISDGAAGPNGSFLPVSGAIVRAADVSSGAVHDSTATGKTGDFRIDALPPGRYSVAVQTDEGLFVSDDVVTLAAGQPGRVSFSLRGRADSGGGAGTPERRKYDCSTRTEDKTLTDAERREKREICGWWATANGWAKFGIIAGSAVALGVIASALSNDGGNNDKEKNPSPSNAPPSSSAP